MPSITKGLRRAALAATITAAGLGAPAVAQTPELLSMATPPEGSTGYLIGTALSTSIVAHTDATRIIQQPFAGAQNWPALMNRGEIDLAMHCGYAQVREAYEGTGIFEQAGPQENVRQVAQGYGLPWGIHVIDPEITSVADLEGRSIFVQVAQNDHVIAIRELLAAAGLDYGTDVEILPFQSPQEAVQGLLTGRGDGMSYGLIPNLAEVQQSRGLHTLSLDPEAVAQVQAAEPVWGDVAIPAGFGPLQPEEELSLLRTPCGMAVGAHVPEEAVYDIMRAIYDHPEEWQDVNPLARQWTIEGATGTPVVPFHEGAVRFLTEEGVWSDAYPVAE